jgi:hypothetical protein
MPHLEFQLPNGTMITPESITQLKEELDFWCESNSISIATEHYMKGRVRYWVEFNHDYEYTIFSLTFEPKEQWMRSWEIID